MVSCLTTSKANERKFERVVRIIREIKSSFQLLPLVQNTQPLWLYLCDDASFIQCKQIKALLYTM